MPTLQVSDLSPAEANAVPAKHPWWRSLLLFLLLSFSVVIYVTLIRAAPKIDGMIIPFLQVWMVSFLPYFAACAFVLITRPTTGRWRWIELGIILLGALVLRAMLLPLPPGLSHDAWRYLWDARVTLHGYSPYVYAPLDNRLAALRDTLILGNSRYRNVPTIYPPGAEGIYVLSYLLAPSNLFVLKSIFVAFDMVTCGALAILLAGRGLDPRRIIIYAWCPLPIVEFAIQGHIDVITLTFTVLAVLTASSTRCGARVLTGILIGLGTLTKIYPILLLVVVRSGDGSVCRSGTQWSGDGSVCRSGTQWSGDGSVCRSGTQWSRHSERSGGHSERSGGRDWPLLLACFVTIIIGYIPFLILGHGQVLGFFLTYASEQGLNAGVTQQVVHWISIQQGLTLATTISVEHIVDVILLGTTSLLVLLLRQRGHLCIESATLLLSGTFLSISSHVFPWYTTALLPWVALLVGPLWTHKRPEGKGIAIAAVWYFTCTSLVGYFFANSVHWAIYYLIVYDVVMAALGLAAIVGVIHYLSFVKKHAFVREKACILFFGKRMKRIK